MKKIAVFLRPGDVLLPGKEMVVNVKPVGAGALDVEVLPAGRKQSIEWRVSNRHQFEIEDRAP